MTPDLQHKAILPHPYQQKGIEPDYWIDTFRQVFFRDPEAGVKVLCFLARHWHFYDRTLLTEEWQVQRQCVIDLLICLGVWRDDVWEQGLDALLMPVQPMPAPNRMVSWFRRLMRIRTKRQDLPKEGL